MHFMNNFNINLSKLPKYTLFNKDLQEEHNPQVLHMISQKLPDIKAGLVKLNPITSDLDTISTVEYNHYIKGLTLKNTINVKYNPRLNLGRRYPEIANDALLPNGNNNPFYGKYHGGLIQLPRIIKNTIFKYGNWIDLDIAKCHPSIIYSIGIKSGMTLNGYESYINPTTNATITNEMIDIYSGDINNLITSKQIKALFNRTVYGGTFNGWVNDMTTAGVIFKNLDIEFPEYISFYEETQLIINRIYDTNVAIMNKVVLPNATIEDTKKRTMSYWCGIVENHITYQAYKFLEKMQVISPTKCSWGYDGLTFKNNNNFKYDTTIDLLNIHIKDNCHLDHIKFIIKPFTEYIELPIIIDQPLSETLTNGELDIEVDIYVEWKDEFERVWCKVINSAIFIKTQIDDSNNAFKSYVFMTKQQLLIAYQHEVYTTVNKQTGAITRKSLVSKWMDDPNMRIYTEMQVIPPPRICPKTTFNLWRPFQYISQPILSTDEHFDTEAVQAFAQHLEIMCDHNEAVFIYFCNWIAHMFQIPAQKPECCINLIGNQGTGKSTITRILSELMGHGYKLETATPERDVWGSFNAPMLHSYLVVLSETDKRNLKENGSKLLKKLITDNTSDSGFTINMKGKDQFGVNSFHRVIQDTNKRDPLETSEDDRRNLVIKCSDELKNNDEYFENFNKIMNKPYAKCSIFWSFYTMDIKKWNFRDIPRTDYHTTMTEESTSPYVLFMEYFTHYFTELSPDDLVTLFGKEVYNLFTKWKQEHGYKFLDNISESILIKNILLELPNLKEFMIKSTRSKQGQARIYNLSRLRDYFKIELLENYGTDTEDDVGC